MSLLASLLCHCCPLNFVIFCIRTNARSFFHSVCVLGYCVFPIDVAAILCTMWNNALFKSIIVPACFAWSTGASVGFLKELVPPRRAVLALYPVALFYLSISWIVFVE